MGRLCLFIVQKLDNMNFIHTFEDENIYKSIIRTMKNIYRILAAAVAAMIAFAGCTKPAGDETGDDEQNVTLNENIVFTIELGEVTANTARITVSHDGVREDTWYGFVTSETDVNAAVLAEIDRLLSEEGKVKVNKSTRKTTTLQGLDPATEYTYVVVGITEAGKLYGEPKSLEFTTAKGEVKFTENSAWTLTYAGAGIINETEYEHTVNITSTDDNKYFVTSYPVSYFDQSQIADFAKKELDYLKEYLARFNAEYGKQYKLTDILFLGSDVEALSLDIQYGTEWYAIAIGVGEDGELSGLWAKSDVITLEEEEMTPEYAAWIGDWTMTGANGITQQVTFSKKIANGSYRMTGYEGEATKGLEVEVLWNAEAKGWEIWNQNLGTYNFGDSGDGDIWFVGEDESGSLYLAEEIPICGGFVAEDGSYVAVGYSEEWENEDGTKGSFVVNDMLFLAAFGPDATGQYSLSYISPTFQTGYPSFPVVFTPASTAAQQSVGVPVRKSQIATKLQKQYSVYGSR